MKKSKLGRTGMRIGALMLSVCLFVCMDGMNAWATGGELMGQEEADRILILEDESMMSETDGTESVVESDDVMVDPFLDSEENTIVEEGQVVLEEVQVLKESEMTYLPYEDATYELKYVDNGTGVEITGYMGTASGRLVLPESIDGKTVNSIGDKAFKNCQKFSGTLTIPKGVTNIGEYAFYSCKRLSGALTIPNGVTNIGEYAFAYCTALSGTLVLPDTVSIIGAGAFQGCTGFSGSLTLPKGISEISKSTFSQCSGMQGTLTIPDTVKIIGEFAFAESGFQGELLIPQGVTAIKQGAFNKCKGFWGDLVIPQGVTEIGQSAFSYCSFTGDLTINEGVTHIGTYAFHSTGFMGSLTLPNSLKEIGSSAFSHSSFTGDLTLPKGIEEIGRAAFEYSFTGTLKILADIPVLPEKAFMHATFKEVIFEEGVTRVPNYAFYECGNIKTVKLPNTLTSMGDGAFRGCASLEEINIPDSVTSIGEDTFRGCAGLEEINIPDSVTIIGKYAFYDCTSLKEINIPDSVTVIRDNAFALCEALEKINFSKGITQIGAGAFCACERLSGTLEIPEGVTVIGNNAFEHCFRLNGKIIVPVSVKSIGTDAFKLESTYTPSPTIIIYGEENSYAQTYAEENGYGFVAKFGAPGHYPLPDELEVEAEVPLGEYWIFLFDNHGEPVTDAQITVDYLNTGNVIECVYENGIVKIPIDETSLKMGISIHAKKEGMVDASAGYAVKNGGSSYLKIRKKTIDPYIDSVMIEGIQNMYADVTRHNYVVYKSDADKGKTVTLRILTSGDTPSRYELVQGDRVIVSSTSNLMTVNLAKELELGGPTPVIVLYDRGERRIFEKKVLFVAVRMDPKLEELSKPKISFGQKLSFGLEDVDIPLLNNSELCLDTQIEFPMKMEFKDNKVRIEIGDMNILEEAGDPKENFKKMIEKYNKEKINAAISNHFRKGNVAGFDVNIQIFGYGEGERDPKTGYTNVEVGLYAKITANNSITWYVFLGPVPFYGKVTGELENQTEGKVVLHVADGKVQNSNVDFGNTLAFTLGAGVGCGLNDAACVDLTGNGKITWEHVDSFSLRELEKNVTDTVSVQAYAKARVVLLFLSWEKTWPSKTLQLYPEVKVLSAGNNGSDLAVLKASDFQVMSRDYLMDNGSLPVLKSNGDDTQVIINGLYPDAKPKLVSYKGTDYLFYLDDQAGRGAEDRTALVYRKEVNGAFGEPVIVEDDKTGDFDYDVKVATDGIYVLWQDGSKSLSGITTLTEAAEALTLSVAKVTDKGVTMLNSPSVTEGLAPISPKLVDTGKEVMACWYENSSNDLLQSGQGTSRFYGQVLDGKSEKQKIGETVRTITTTDFGMFEDALSVAYTVDEDNDISTVEDREIYVTSKGEGKRLTENSVIDSNAQFGTVFGKQVIVYYSDRNLACMDGTTTELLLDAEDAYVTSGLISDDFLFTSESASPAIVWKDAYWMGEETGQGMTMIRFKDGSWSKPTRVAGTTDSLVAYSVLEKTADVVRVVYTAKGELDGKEITRLYETEGRERASIGLVRISYEQEDYVPGENLPFSVTLQNTGALNTEDYEIVITNEAGETIHTQKGIESIPVGEEKVITLANFSPKDTGDLQILKIQINGDGRKQDAMNFTLGGADLGLRTEVSYEEDEQLLNLQMINGSNMAENMKLIITGAEDEVLYEKEYEAVPGKSSVNYLCKLDKFFKITESDSIKLKLESLGRTETYLFDNETTLYRPGSVTRITEVTLVKKELELTSGDNVQLNVTTDGEGTVLYESNNPDCVSVSESGVVKAKAAGSATITAYTEDGGSAICIITVKEAAPSKAAIVLGDVAESSWQYKFVKYACENDYMKGKKTDEEGRILFDPEGTLTRAEFIQVLYNAEGKPNVTYKDRFSDVPDNKWYTDAIIWGTEKGIVSGYGDGNYGVSDPITREQLATMLNKYAQYKGYKVDATTKLDAYTDTSKISNWAVGYMKWIVGSSIMSGKGDRLDPQGNATRAECATLVNKFHISYEE